MLALQLLYPPPTDRSLVVINGVMKNKCIKGSRYSLPKLATPHHSHHVMTLLVTISHSVTLTMTLGSTLNIVGSRTQVKVYQCRGINLRNSTMRLLSMSMSNNIIAKLTESKRRMLHVVEYVVYLLNKFYF